MKQWKFDKLTDNEKAVEIERLENRIPAKRIGHGNNGQPRKFHGKAVQRKLRRARNK